MLGQDLCAVLVRRRLQIAVFGELDIRGSLERVRGHDSDEAKNQCDDCDRVRYERDDKQLLLSIGVAKLTKRWRREAPNSR